MQLKHLFLVAEVAAAQCALGCTIDVVAPVCASDNKTYNNSCLVKVAACSEKKNITVVSQGECTICTRICNAIFSPVCGSDGKTYGNACELSIATCKTASITLVSRGWCENISNTMCKTRCNFTYKPVCGSNGETYANDCELKNAACDVPNLTKVVDDECPERNNSTNTTQAPSTTQDNSATGAPDVPKTAVAPTTTTTKSAAATSVFSLAMTTGFAIMS